MGENLPIFFTSINYSPIYLLNSTHSYTDWYHCHPHVMMKVAAELYKKLSISMVKLPVEHRKAGMNYGKAVFSKTRMSSHIQFIRTCLHRNVIPNGFKPKHHWSFTTPSSIDSSEQAVHTLSKRIMRLKLHEFTASKDKFSHRLDLNRSLLDDALSRDLLSYVKSRVYVLNSELFESLKSVKAKKLAALLPPSSVDDTPERTVVTIPEDLLIDPAIVEILSKGSKFIPTPQEIDKERLDDSLRSFFRRVKLHAFFNDPNASIRNDPHMESDSEEEDVTFKDYVAEKACSTFTPPADKVHPAVDTFIRRCNEEYENLDFSLPSRSNVTHKQQKALRSILKRDDLVVKPADKGGAIVVLTRSAYVAEAERQLSDTTFYRKDSEDLTITNLNIIKDTIQEEIDSGNLSPSAICMVSSSAKCSRFYLTIKIHKQGNPGRPVISGCGAPTEQLSAFLDDIFQPINTRLPSYVKDTNHLLQIFGSVPPTKPGEKRLLFKKDVTSLYTTIPNNDGLLALKFWLEKEESFPHPIHTILRLAELVLTLNHFEFNGDHYTQIRGVAMGTRMGPSYACLFMGWIEHCFFESYTGPVPEVYIRFIDDTEGTTVMERSDLEKFIEAFGNFHPAVGITSEISETSMDTLDLIVSVNEDGTLSSSIYYKPTDAHSYVHYSSNHPRSCLNSIPYSQFLRLRRICSSETDFFNQCEIMSTFFRKRGYPEAVIQKAFKRVQGVTREVALTPKVKQSSGKIPISLPYHAGLSPQITKIIKNNAELLARDPQIGFLFVDKFITSYSNLDNVKKLSMRSKLRSSEGSGEIPGNFPCGVSRCLTCDLLSAEPLVVGPCGSFEITSSFSCNSRNVLYVIHCSKCDMLYIGETGMTLRNRKNGHMSDIRLRKIEKNEVAEHFCSSPHNIQDDFSIRAILTIEDQHQRRLFEAKLVRKLGTLRPMGMNREESTAHR